MDLSKLDLDRLKSDLTDALSDGLADLVDGAKDDIKAYASDISKDMLEAHMTGQVEVKEQLMDQLKVLAEINRVRVENHTWVVVRKVVEVAFKAATAGALSVLL